LPAGFTDALHGRTIVAIERRAKFLLFQLEDDHTWLVHLGMSGRFRLGEENGEAALPHDHVILRTNDGCMVRYHDPRRFGFMDLVPSRAIDAHPRLAKLGPDPLGPGFTGTYLAERLSGRMTSIKAALLDQRIVAGMGNIYASESLFRAGLSPRRSAVTILGRRADALVRAIRQVLEDAIAAGGSSLRDYRQPSGELGYFQNAFAVYGREREACPGCRCDWRQGGGIRRIVQNGRATFYCPRRQR
jgi:formamidopyrimidine-DNA glycosylase